MRNKLLENAAALDLVSDPWPASLIESLLSRSDELFGRFMELRKQADRDLGHLPQYPWGQCETITRRVRSLAIGKEWMKEWTDLGIRPRRIYGILKDLYFQNAIQLGPLYIDPANNTVNVTIPPVEILPASKVLWCNLSDPAEYRRVARRYLNLAIYPNTCLPVLFPFIPFIAINAEGHVFPLRHQDVILWKDAAADFELSDRWLAGLDADDRLPAIAEATLAEAVAADGFPLEWSPCAPSDIRSSVLPDYRQQLDSPNLMSLFKTALRLRDASLKQLYRQPARIGGNALAGLQESGHAPRPRDIHDLSWTR
ncbi:hypothetical protein OVA24_13810 [Luteolibacter sp. SL250]|uniref:hypothetical protein n=1 Tax=Luteolibacter sp. SL250 TaxID=2995170 RepID=UPI00226D8A46|nr:hypothetical protein [Luteolibacter sp. SL250]WAC18310.1 hypothetical protein OVA24_13810 [Luteolibacter sp. SL250]